MCTDTQCVIVVPDFKSDFIRSLWWQLSLLFVSVLHLAPE